MAQVLRDNGFRHVEVTVECGDQGVDILAVRGGKTYAIQCKNYAGAVGNTAVQEAYAGAEYYGCDIPVVVCRRISPSRRGSWRNRRAWSCGMENGCRT